MQLSGSLVAAAVWAEFHSLKCRKGQRNLVSFFVTTGRNCHFLGAKPYRLLRRLAGVALRMVHGINDGDAGLLNTGCLKTRAGGDGRVVEQFLGVARSLKAVVSRSWC